MIRSLAAFGILVASMPFQAIAQGAPAPGRVFVYNNGGNPGGCRRVSEGEWDCPKAAPLPRKEPSTGAYLRYVTAGEPIAWQIGIANVYTMCGFDRNDHARALDTSLYSSERMLLLRRTLGTDELAAAQAHFSHTAKAAQSVFIDKNGGSRHCAVLRDRIVRSGSTF